MPDAISRAAVLLEPERLEIQEFELPKIGSDDGLLRVEAAGICGSDWAQYLGTQKFLPTVYPIIPGHEIVGRIDKIGSDAVARWGVTEGDRVAVGMQIGTRGVYGLTFSTEEQPGLWGGYSQYMYLHPDSALYKVPEGVSAELAALYVPISNGIRWAVYLPMLELGDIVVVQGPGQQGLGCVVAAREAGASLIIVTGTSADKSRLEVARSLGADVTVDVDSEDPVEVVRISTHGRMADIVLDVSAGATAPVALALEMVRRGGQVVLAGLKEYSPVPQFISDKIVLSGISVHGSSSPRGTRNHDPGKPIRSALELMCSRRYPLDLMCTHKFPLADSEEAVKIIGRAIPGKDGIHVTICPEL